MSEVALLKLIADFECVSRDDVKLLAGALGDRYGVGDLGDVDSVLEVLIAKGFLEVTGSGCLRLSSRGLEFLRGVFAKVNYGRS